MVRDVVLNVVPATSLASHSLSIAMRCSNTRLETKAASKPIKSASCGKKQNALQTRGIAAQRSITVVPSALGSRSLSTGPLESSGSYSQATTEPRTGAASSIANRAGQFSHE